MNYIRFIIYFIIFIISFIFLIANHYLHKFFTFLNQITLAKKKHSKEEYTNPNNINNNKDKNTNYKVSNQVDKVTNIFFNNKKINDYKFFIFFKKFQPLLRFAKSNFFFLFSFFIFIFVIYFSYQIYNLPNYKELADYKPALITRVYTEDGYILSELAKEKRYYTLGKDIPEILKNAFISAEDKNFYHHSGFDYKGLVRASLKNLTSIVTGKNIEGASTISQQVVKNFLLNNERTITRKIKEAFLTYKIESYYSKDKILELYLNKIYLGKSSYGVSIAALNYFNKPLTDLTLAEVAFLAALPKAPSKYDPEVNYNASKQRRDWVLERLYADGKITQEQFKKTIAEPIILYQRENLKNFIASYAVEEVRKDLIQKFGYDSIYEDGLTIKTTINYDLQKLAYDSLREGIEAFDKKLGYRGALTNINLESFKIENNPALISKDIIKNLLFILKKNPTYINFKEKVVPYKLGLVVTIEKETAQVLLANGDIISLILEYNTWAYNPFLPLKKKEKPKRILQDLTQSLHQGDLIILDSKNISKTIKFKGKKQLVEKTVYFLKQIPKVNGAILVMNSKNGNILAMQGGYSFALSEFNRVTQAFRQPGSSFKPFVYLSALSNGIKPNDLFLDAPFISETDNLKWKPKNHLGKYNGYVTLRNALEYSRNLVTIRVAERVGLDYISSVAQTFGIYDKKINDLSGSLGSQETSLLKMVRAYAMLSNLGYLVDSNLILSVQQRDNTYSYKSTKNICNYCNGINYDESLHVPIFAEMTEKIYNSQDVYQIVNMLQGTVERGTAIAAKIKGYEIAGKTGTTNDSKDAWFIGFTPEIVVGIYIGYDEPESLGDYATGTSLAVPIFKSFMKKALIKYDKIPFPVPSGIKIKIIDYKTGNFPNKNEEIDSENSFEIQEVFKDTDDLTPNLNQPDSNIESNSNEVEIY
jgi:penicillin-binding protein 1A